MKVPISIEYEQLVQIIKALPPEQLRKLQMEIEKEAKKGYKQDLETLLLNGPVATEQQLQAIQKNREAINQWRKE
ncbi:MAG: hypothetical protein BRD50_06865 [Bacteroidetes bacterium SW_11_45_7]|nr:MAG: hypothetical protein BRD50_06865 [Bacteroidetes bacterium SW_11_45_7]